MPVPRGIPGLSRLRTRAFSTSVARTSYEDTVQNLKIGKHTRVLYQGFTGRVATQNAKESLEWGTNIVGGVKPGSTGEHLGLPVLPTVREAKEQLKPDATAIYVAAPHAGKAIEEAIEAEIPLIVAVAEHIPLHDILRVLKQSELKMKQMLTLVDRVNPEDSIEEQIGWCKCSRHHLSNRQVQDRLPTTTNVLSWTHWNRGQVRHSELRDCGFDHSFWTRPKSMYRHGR